MHPVSVLTLFFLCAGGAIYFSACLVALYGYVRKPRYFDPDYRPTVAIIVAARNEEHQIIALLDDLLMQDYPKDKYSITVVDDRSEDGTAAVVKEYTARERSIQLCDTWNSKSPYTHKKRAIHEGIMSTNSEVIMTTDADCRVGPRWIRNMVGYLNDGVELVTSEVFIGGGGIMANLEALDFTGIQTVSAGLMNAGLPITCNGPSLCYLRSAFERVGGYGNYGVLVSGDDDLIMQKIAQGDSSRVTYSLDPETVVYVDAAESPDAFLSKRARWASKTSKYPLRWAVAMLALIYLFMLAIPVSVVLAAIGWMSWLPFIAVFGIKTLLDFVLTAIGMLHHHRVKPLLLFPLAELLHVPYIIFIAPKGLFFTFEWHGRKTKAQAGEND